MVLKIPRCTLDILTPTDKPGGVFYCHISLHLWLVRLINITMSISGTYTNRAGEQHLLMKGPPGSGKTMMARRLPTILPDLTFAEALETTKIYSVMGLLKNSNPLLAARPFRAPHHTISDAGLIGGGQTPKPGEVSLAHNGVLFLDESPEFKKNVLEVLRQPLEDGTVTISRATGSLSFPSRFILVIAFNPCPCGYLGDMKHNCRCTPAQVQRYEGRLSGPLLDRIDMHRNGIWKYRRILFCH
jgi:magnesium chelatase family protein